MNTKLPQQRIPLRHEVQVAAAETPDTIMQFAHAPYTVLLPNTVEKVLTIPGAPLGQEIERTLVSTVVLSQKPQDDVHVTPREAKRLVQGLRAEGRRVVDGKRVLLTLVPRVKALVPDDLE